jgi:hypothetical protein
MADQPRDPSLTKIDQTELPRTSPKDKYTEQLVEQAAPTHPPKSRKKLYLELELLIALILVGGIGYALHLRSPATAPKLTTASSRPQPAKEVPSTVSSSLLETPKLIADPGIITDYGLAFGTDCSNVSKPVDINSCPPTNQPSDIKYYTIGQTYNGDAIDVIIPKAGDVGSIQQLIMTKDASGHYTIYGLLSGLVYGGDKYSPYNDEQAKSFQKAVNPKLVTVDTTKTIPELDFPGQLTIQGLSLQLAEPSLSSRYFTNGLEGLNKASGGFNSSSMPFLLTKLGQSTGRDYYAATVSDSVTYQLREIVGVVRGDYMTNYKLSQPYTSTIPPAITWTDGGETTNTATYINRTPSCGFAFSYVTVKNVDPATLISAGKGPDGEAIYQLPTNQPFFQEVYNVDYAKGEYLQDSKLKNLSVSEYQKAHALFIVKNAIGDYTAYLRQDLFGGGGCGKPVVYLYPTRSTDVSVTVGAEVTESIPAYSKASGWQHVTAKPNGQLTYRGKSYDSLFWEGLGHGAYPAITEGTIVARNQVVSTITNQLKAQGFNEKETRDFLNFWQPRLPDAPYTRLTWFDTTQMNALAPLRVTPQPQTVLRSFLDFQGLQTPINITPQSFKTPERNGFTLVEWGGQLRS